MHTTKDYSKSITPSFDAVEDVKKWLGRKWDTISPQISKIKDREQFALYADLAGIQGFPVAAWYELYHGQGSWHHTMSPEEAIQLLQNLTGDQDTIDSEATSVLCNFLICLGHQSVVDAYNTVTKWEA